MRPERVATFGSEMDASSRSLSRARSSEVVGLSEVAEWRSGAVAEWGEAEVVEWGEGEVAEWSSGRVVECGRPLASR